MRYTILLNEQTNLDIFCVCETFLHDEFNDFELHLNNYELFRKDRHTHGGGLAIYTKNNVPCTRRVDLEIDGIEAMWLEIKLDKQCPILLGYVYRPPSSS